MQLLFQVSSWNYECQPDGPGVVPDSGSTRTETLLALVLLRLVQVLLAWQGSSRCAAGRLEVLLARQPGRAAVQSLEGSHLEVKPDSVRVACQRKTL